MNEPNVTNRAVEQAAIAFVLECERAAGRKPQDTRGTGAVADLVSGHRVIEVKAYGGSSRGIDLWLEVRQVEEARTNVDFWLYIVENVRQGDPSLFRLIVVGGDDLARLLARAREKRYYEVPWPTGVYDRLLQSVEGS